jgi:protease I
MNVLMVIAPEGFRDEELFEPRWLMERAGHTITIASTRTGQCTGTGGASVMSAAAIDLIDTRRLDAVVFVGGAGARALFDDRDAQRIAKEMALAHKIVGAICVAPVILARAGVLRGKRATVFPTEVRQLLEAHAQLRSLGVVSDGNVVTSSGPDHAHAFGERLVKMLADAAGLPARPAPEQRAAPR